MDLSKVGFEGKPVERAWTAKDCMLYALGVGAGVDELEYFLPEGQKVLPTMAVVLGGGGPLYEAGTWKRGALVHGEEAIEVMGPLPPEGRIVSQGRIAGIYDKGKGALLVLESTSRDAATGDVRFKTRMGLFIRGEGGFGGERGPSLETNAAPDRKPDAEVPYETRPDQALLYRLNGDPNPLHFDPEFAKRAGFEKPILHGLCTWGFTGRALLHTVCRSDPGRFRSMEGRFSKPVFPGQTLSVSIWVDGDQATFRTTTGEGVVVLDQGRCRFAP